MTGLTKPKAPLHEPHIRFVDFQRLMHTAFMASIHVQFLEVFPFHEPFVDRSHSAPTGLRPKAQGWSVCGPTLGA